MIGRASNTKNITIAAAAAEVTAENCESCSVRTIIEEAEFIGKLQSMADYGNLHILKSFKIKLEFDEEGGLTLNG
jgi:hypothetical protein